MDDWIAELGWFACCEAFKQAERHAQADEEEDGDGMR